MDESTLAGGAVAVVVAVLAFFGGRYRRRSERATATKKELELYEQRIENLTNEVHRSQSEVEVMRQDIERLKLQVDELSNALVDQKRLHAAEVHELHLIFEEDKQRLIQMHKTEIERMTKRHAEEIVQLRGAS